jgi:hypothetical protein
MTLQFVPDRLKQRAFEYTHAKKQLNTKCIFFISVRLKLGALIHIFRGINFVLFYYGNRSMNINILHLSCSFKYDR